MVLTYPSSLASAALKRCINVRTCDELCQKVFVANRYQQRKSGSQGEGGG